MPRNIYLDESGDLGWTFDKPYMNGGSSRFLTIAYIIVPQQLSHKVKRLVKDVYNHFRFDTKKEIKGSNLTLAQKEYICHATVKLLNNNLDFILGAITLEKDNAKPHMRVDSNKLYNYMMKLAILNKVMTSPTVCIIRDEKSVKVKSGNSCIDYLQITMTFELNSETKLRDMPSASHTCLNLIFIDWITNIVWSYYERGIEPPFLILSNNLRNETLFF